LQPGDELIVSELSRLGRSTVDVLSTLKLLRERDATDAERQPLALAALPPAFTRIEHPGVRRQHGHPYGVKA
jgi:hypothetical protein